MAKPKRTFTGQEGQRSTGTAGPDAIRRDFDSAFAMFDPADTLPDGDPGGIGSENIKDGAGTDAVIGERTVDDANAPTSNTGTLTSHLSGLANRIKAITGASTWRSAPATTLSSAKAHMDASAPHSGHASKSVLDAHIGNKENPHQVTAEQIGAATHAALTSHTGNKSNPHGVTAKQVGAITSVAGIDNPGGGVDIVAGTGITVSKDATGKRVVITSTGGQAPAAHGDTHEQGGADEIPSLPTPEEKAALAGTYGEPGASNTYVTDSDPRMTDARTPTQHTHPWGDVTGKPTTFPPSSHTHPWSAITDKPAAFKPEAHTHPWGEITEKPTAFPPQSHDHDTRYYTRSQIDNLIGSAESKHVYAVADGSMNYGVYFGSEELDRDNHSIYFYVPFPGKYRIEIEAYAVEQPHPWNGWSDPQYVGGKLAVVQGGVQLSDSVEIRSYTEEVQFRTLTMDYPCGAGWIRLAFDPDRIEFVEDDETPAKEYMDGLISIVQAAIYWGIEEYTTSIVAQSMFGILGTSHRYSGPSSYITASLDSTVDTTGETEAEDDEEA